MVSIKLYPTVELLSGNGRDRIIHAARVCRDSFDRQTPEGDDALLRDLITNEHYTCLEHAGYTIACEQFSEPLRRLVEGMDKPPLTRYRRPAQQLWHYAALRVMSVNAAQAYAMAHIEPEDGDWAAHYLAARIAQHDPSLAGSVLPDLSEERLDSFATPRTGILTEEQMTPEERMVFPWRTVVVRCSRACADQLRTHRTLSHEMRSQRAVDEMDPKHHGVSYWPCGLTDVDYCSPYVNEDGASHFTLEDIAHAVYRENRSDGMTKQRARYGLLMSQGVVHQISGNMRSWRHLLALRSAKGPDEEIRFIAWQIRRLFAGDGLLDVVTSDLPTISKQKIEPWIDAYLADHSGSPKGL